MRLRPTIQTLGLLLLCSASSFASLGETKDQCRTRYGVPIREDSSGGAEWFKKNGIEIFTAYSSGACFLITFKKSEGRLSDKEIDELLTASRGAKNLNWQKLHPGVWGRADKATATLGKDGMLTLAIDITTLEE